MTSKPKIEEADLWLQSDGQLWGRTFQAPNKKGIELTLQMPDGEPLVAQIEKLSAASVTQFCDLARGTYHERKAEQAAKKVSNAAMRKPTLDVAEASAAPLEEGVFSGILTREAILFRVGDLSDKLTAYKEVCRTIIKERDQLQRIAEVLDASEDNDKEPANVSPEEGEEPDRVSDVVKDSRPAKIVCVREAGTAEQDEDS